ncbi:hypothetical protein Pelo_17084 [Pelomyxa schiedti]|nr:hypothetical protein Pelo_17084 [Pelomyxa schiedti]
MVAGGPITPTSTTPSAAEVVVAAVGAVSFSAAGTAAVASRLLTSPLRGLAPKVESDMVKVAGFLDRGIKIAVVLNKDVDASKNLTKLLVGLIP